MVVHYEENEVGNLNCSKWVNISLLQKCVNGFLELMQGVIGLPVHLQIWVGTLVLINIIAPLFFLEKVEAWASLAAGILGVVIMSMLTLRFGFSRIIGLGHVAWLPLIAFLGTRLTDSSAADTFGIWIRLVILIDAISLAFDALDVYRYARGERATPSLVTPQE